MMWIGSAVGPTGRYEPRNRFHILLMIPWLGIIHELHVVVIYVCQTRTYLGVAFKTGITIAKC